MEYYEHEKLRIKVLKCNWKEFEGKIVETYYRFSNGVNFVSKYGLIFLNHGEYEVVEGGE